VVVLLSQTDYKQLKYEKDAIHFLGIRKIYAERVWLLNDSASSNFISEFLLFLRNMHKHPHYCPSIYMDRNRTLSIMFMLD